jgi:hypothetical protein
MSIRSTALRSFLANASLLAGVSVSAFLANPRALIQNLQLQERVTEIKQAAALNKQALAQYTWQEQQTISIKLNVKKQRRFLVRLGPDGKPEKTEIDPQEQSSGGRKHGLKHRNRPKSTAARSAALLHSHSESCVLVPGVTAQEIILGLRPNLQSSFSPVTFNSFDI